VAPPAGSQPRCWACWLGAVTSLAGACAALADSVAHVRAQTGEAIPAAQAQQLVADAARLRAQLGRG
jgi:hypothetical protein